MPARGTVRTLRQQEELPLLRDHLLRLDRESRRDRFHGFIDDRFIERYAGKCADDGTVIVAYIEGGAVHGAAELHPPDQSQDSLPEIAFSVEACVRRQGVGSILFKKIIEGGAVHGAAELHPPDQSQDSLPEIAFSVEACVRRQGVGSILFKKLIEEARAKGYRSLRINTGAQNQAMRALAHKFGADLTFRHGESTGTIDLTQ